jgi:excisionase family DNA binding protein
MAKLLTIPEVMKALRVSHATVYRILANDALPFVKIRRRTLVSRDALDAFVQQRQHLGRDAQASAAQDPP